MVEAMEEVVEVVLVVEEGLRVVNLPVDMEVVPGVAKEEVMVAMPLERWLCPLKIGCRNFIIQMGNPSYNEHYLSKIIILLICP